MDAFALTTTSNTSCSFTLNKSLIFPSKPFRIKTRSSLKRTQFIWLPRKTVNFVLRASKDEEPKLDEWDQMEMKFGRILGEDPKLTHAKIMARKANPDVSYLEVEKSFYKNKGKLVEIKELPFDVSDIKRPSKSSDGLNLVRPVPKNGFEVKPEDKTPAGELKKPIRPALRVEENTRSKVPNVILRKPPSMYVEDDVEDKTSRNRVRIKPNLTLRMNNNQSRENFSDMTLLRRPKPVIDDDKEESSAEMESNRRNGGRGLTAGSKEGDNEYLGFTLLEKPEKTDDSFEEPTKNSANVEDKELEEDTVSEMQPLEKIKITSEADESNINEQPDKGVGDSNMKFTMETALQGKPMRFERPVNNAPISNGQEAIMRNLASEKSPNDAEDVRSISPAESSDWSRAEALLKSGDRVEVELVSSSTRGFVVSFGSLVGFLPYRNLGSRWKFLAFESWLRHKGLDPSKYKQNLGVHGGYDGSEASISLYSSTKSEVGQSKTTGVEITPDMKLNDLIRIYNEEKLKFLKSFVGQKIKVNVVMVDWKLGKLIVSLRPKEKEELVEKKRNLMAKLQVGDVVKCCIKKITYFGIFVEVEGVSALIHQSEVSWDATLDPASCFKVGQIVEAKVHQLDFTLDRIFLSLKEITPDPLIEALESVVGGNDSLDARLQPAKADSEWADAEMLIKELRQIEGIESVTKGRFFLSPGLAPTFQVYMTSMFEDQYKLLARYGNKVQEVIVKASLNKEEMKSMILSCTNRVE